MFSFSGFCSGIGAVLLVLFLFVGESCGRSASLIDEPHRQPVYQEESFFSSPSFDIQKELYPELLSNQLEGDILMPPQYDSRNAVRSESMKWPGARIPYTFNDTFDDPEEMKKVRDAMDGIEEKTCVRFIPWTNESVYIVIGKDQPGCYALVGYQPSYGKQLPVNLESPGCLRHQGTIQHELLHVTGMFHEQSRPDRDDYVKINWDNIDKNYHRDFSKGNYRIMTTHHLPYDTKSVMHYPNDAFSVNGKDTITLVPKKSFGFMSLLPGSSQEAPYVKMGQRVGATDTDLKKVSMMYKCSGTY